MRTRNARTAFDPVCERRKLRFLSQRTLSRSAKDQQGSRWKRCVEQYSDAELWERRWASCLRGAVRFRRMTVRPRTLEDGERLWKLALGQGHREAGLDEHNGYEGEGAGQVARRLRTRSDIRIIWRDYSSCEGGAGTMLVGNSERATEFEFNDRATGQDRQAAGPTANGG